MPNFMDRHNAPDVTHEAVAEAHRLDLEVQEQYGWLGDLDRLLGGGAAGRARVPRVRGLRGGHRMVARR